jgi:very-short-patch-repair endonuclease
LRKNATEAEKILWKRLSKSQTGFKFIRQYSIKNWVVDFYCPEKRIAVEVDGKIHQKQKPADNYRDRFLENMGIKVLRITNEDVETDADGVVVMLVKRITSPNAPS